MLSLRIQLIQTGFTLPQGCIQTRGIRAMDLFCVQPTKEIHGQRRSSHSKLAEICLDEELAKYVSTVSVNNSHLNNV